MTSVRAKWPDQVFVGHWTFGGHHFSSTVKKKERYLTTLQMFEAIECWIDVIRACISIEFPKVPGEIPLGRWEKCKLYDIIRDKKTEDVTETVQ